MARRQYNSATDRRWQQRYQRIQERKESVPDVETPRDERRRQKRTLYKSRRINADMIIPDKTAFVCENTEQIRQVYYAVQSKNPEFVRWETLEGLEISFYFGTYEPSAIGILTQESWFGRQETSLKVKPVSQFEKLGFEIMEFCMLFPVIDLGKVKESPETVEFLLGI